MSETFEQAIERCLMDGTTAKALRLISAGLDDASDDCIDAIAISQGADGLDTLVARVADLSASRDRASDACASVQRERDDLREMLGEAAAMISAALADDDGFSLDEAFIWERPIEKRPLVTFGMLRNMRATFLTRCEGAKV